MKSIIDKILQFFLPDASTVSVREKLLSGFLALIAMLTVLSLSHLYFGLEHTPFLLASMGATSVLLFAAPYSPVSQPWAILGGHAISALIGVLCFQAFDQLIFAASFAVGISILFMYLFNCLHPPGGATALGFVIAGPEIHALGYEYLFSPVMSNIIVLFVLGLALNNLVPGRRYPVASERKPVDKSEAWAVGKSVFDQSDLDIALKEADIFLDISRSDLNKIYRLAVKHANERRLGDVFCRDIMTKNPTSLEYGIELHEAWRILHENKIKAAPVVDRFNRIIGIVTLTDFMRHANLHSEGDLQAKMKRFLARTDGHTSDKVEVVGQIMTESPIVVSEDDHIVDLVPIFTEKNIHHLPVVDERKKLTGMITRSDIMRALALLRV